MLYKELTVELLNPLSAGDFPAQAVSFTGTAGSTDGWAAGPEGVMVCTSCHDPHSGRNSFLLRRKGSELCLGCHPATRYDVGKMAAVR